MALAQTAGPSTAYSGLEHLLKYYRTRIFDSDLNLPRPWQTADLAEHYVDQVRSLSCAPDMCQWHASMCVQRTGCSGWVDCTRVPSGGESRLRMGHLQLQEPVLPRSCFLSWCFVHFAVTKSWQDNHALGV